MLFEIRYIAPYTREDREGLCRAIEAALLAQHFKPVLGESCEVLEICDRRMFEAKASHYARGVRADLILTRINKLPVRAGFIYVMTQPEMRMLRDCLRTMPHLIDDEHNSMTVELNVNGDVVNGAHNAMVSAIHSAHKVTYASGVVGRLMDRAFSGIPIAQHLMVLGLNVEGLMDPSWPNPMYVAVVVSKVRGAYPDRLMQARMCDHSHEAKA